MARYAIIDREPGGQPSWKGKELFLVTIDAYRLENRKSAGSRVIGESMGS